MFNLGFIEPIDTSQNTYLETQNETSKLTSHTTDYSSLFSLGTEYTTNYSTDYVTSNLNTDYGQTSIETNHSTDKPTNWSTAYTNTQHDTGKPTSHTSYYNTIYSLNTIFQTSNLTAQETSYSTAIGIDQIGYYRNTDKPTSHSTDIGTVFYNTYYDVQTKHQTEEAYFFNTNHNTSVYGINTYIAASGGTSWAWFNNPDASSNTSISTEYTTYNTWFNDWVTESNYTQLDGTWRSYSYVESNFKDTRLGTSDEEFTKYSSSTGGNYYAPEQAHTNYNQTLVAGRLYQRRVVEDTLTYNNEKIRWIRGTYYTNRYNSQADGNTWNVYAQYLRNSQWPTYVYLLSIVDGTTTSSTSYVIKFEANTTSVPPLVSDPVVVSTSNGSYEYVYAVLNTGEWFYSNNNAMISDADGGAMRIDEVYKINYVAFKKTSGVGSGLEIKYSIIDVPNSPYKQKTWGPYTDANNASFYIYENYYRLTRHFNSNGSFYIYQSDGTTLIDVVHNKVYSSSYITDSTSSFVWRKGTFTSGIPSLTSSTSGLTDTWWRHTLEWWATNNYRETNNDYEYYDDASFRTEWTTISTDYTTSWTCYWNWGYTTVLITTFNTNWDTTYYNTYDTYYDTTYHHQTWYVSDATTNYDTAKPTFDYYPSTVFGNTQHNTDKPTLYNTSWNSQEQTSHLTQYNTQKPTLYTSYMNTQFNTLASTTYNSLYNTYQDTLYNTSYTTSELINESVQYSVNTSHLTENYATYYNTFFNTEYRFG